MMVDRLFRHMVLAKCGGTSYRCSAVLDEAAFE